MVGWIPFISSGNSTFHSAPEFFCAAHSLLSEGQTIAAASSSDDSPLTEVKVPCLREINCSALIMDVLLVLCFLVLLEVILCTNKSDNPSVSNWPPKRIDPNSSSLSSFSLSPFKTLAIELIEEFGPNPWKGVEWTFLAVIL